MKLRRFPLFAICTSVLVLSSTAFAATLTWDSTATSPTAPVNGTGAWNTVTSNWSDGTTDNIWNNANNDTAVFGGGTSTGTAGTVTLGTDITANGLTFNIGDYIITSNTLTLAGTTPTIDTGANAATINSILAGSAGFTKSGSGALTLGGGDVNSFTGQLIISTGTVKAGKGSALGAGGGGNETIVQSDATFDVGGQTINNTEIIQIAGAGVGGNGALINSGGENINALNNVTLTADATIGGTGRFDIRGGPTPSLDLAGFTLNKVGNNHFGVVGANVSNGNININAGILAIETDSTVTGTGTITIANNGTLGLYGVANITRDITSNGGTISNLGLAAAINSNINLAAGTTTISGAKDTTLRGNLTGTGGMEKTDGGKLTLSGTSSIGSLIASGGTITSTGSLTVSGDAIISQSSGATFNQTAGTVNFTSTSGGFGVGFNIAHKIGANGAYNLSGGILNVTAIAQLTAGGSETGNFNISGGIANMKGGIDKATSGSGAGNLTLTGGRINIGGAGITNSGGGTGTISLGAGTVGALANWSSAQNMTLTSATTGTKFNTLDSADSVTARTITLSGVLSGANAKLTKDGAGMLVLSGANNYTGATTVSGGTLLINGNNGGATGAVIVASGATLGGSGTVGGATTINGTHNVGGGADRTQNFSGNLTYNTGSIFNWDLDAGASDTGSGATNSGTYDQVIAAGSVTKDAGAGAIFNIVLGGTDAFTDAFWNTAKSWSDIFSTGSSSDSLATIFTSFGGDVPTTGIVSGRGQFTFTSNTLNWSAVPEPTSALAGLLLAAGLLRRRRVA